MAGSNFHISKWYLDVVVDDGRGIIGYDAQLTWKSLRLPYISLLQFYETPPIKIQSRFHHSEVLSDNGERLLWEAPRLGIKSTWRRIDAPLQACLFDHPKGQLNWYCRYPRARVKLEAAGRTVLEGLGYAEKLELSIEPWHIPLQTLRWGRFLSELHCLVWIEFGASSPRQWVFLNGYQMADAYIGEKELRIPSESLQLKMTDQAILEQEPKILNVARSITRRLPGFRQIIPDTFLLARETKWRSRGRLYKNGVLLGEGWSIHELLDMRVNKKENSILLETHCRSGNH